MEDRRLRQAAAVRQYRRDANAGVQDAVLGPSDPSEFERFEDLTSRLDQVPKKYLDEKRGEDG